MKGWIRYWISDNSGANKNKWQYLYFPYACQLSSKEAIDTIVREYESWALYLDSYSYDIEFNVIPTIEVLIEEVVKVNKEIRSKQNLKMNWKNI